MKSIWTILCMLSIFSLHGQSDRNLKTYFESGKLEMEVQFDESCKCDKMTVYFENGKVHSTKSYVHNGLFNRQLEGLEISYFENGNIMFYYFWNNGSPSGRAFSNFADGTLGYEMFFANKYKTGTWRYFNPDSSLREEMIFLDNKTPWDSDEDYAFKKFYFNNKLAYTLQLVAGKKTNITVIDTISYENLIAAEWPNGQRLFIQNCAACHSATTEIVGPKMEGITNIRTNEWLQKMITNGNALIESGDKDAIALYKKYNMPHPNFERLTNEEVTSIIDYLKTLNTKTDEE